jgi:hypothetical protein
MPIPTTIADLSVTAASNSPAGSDSTATNDDYLRSIQSLVRSFYAISVATIASAATTDIGASSAENVTVTGTASITSLGTGYEGCLREVYCTGTPTFVHSAALALPGAASIAAAVGDFFIFRCMSPGNWAMVAGSRGASSLVNAVLTGTSTTNGIEIGYRTIPGTVKNSNYTLLAADSARALYHDDTSSYSYTVNTGVMSGGEAVVVVNNTASGAITLVQGAGMTLRLANSALSGNRTVAVRGVATIYYVSPSLAYVSGAGVS